MLGLVLLGAAGALVLGPPGPVRIADRATDWPVLVLLAVAVSATVAVRSTLGAVALLGLTGLVVAGWFLLAGAAAEPAVALAGAVVLVALAVKSAVVPVHGWLPASYSHCRPAVAVLFPGLLTKVGVYAVVRLYAVLYGGDERWPPWVLAAALVTMVVGVLGAGERAVRSVLTFHR